MSDIPRDLDLGALLAEQTFVRRLVRSLVFKEADADDVTQQTWLVALRQARPGASATRPFLARLARGVASNFARGEGRRRRREQQATPAEPSPAVADVFARESLRQQVVAELAALSEPYRSTLVLRFFEDLTPQAIAQRLGVPDATVRARLKRGLDALRARLDQRYGGDRAAWCTALLPLTEGGRDATPVTLAATAAFGLHQLLLPAAGLLLVVALATWLGDDRPAATPLGVQAPATLVAEATTPATAAAAEAEPVRAPIATAAPSPNPPAEEATVDNGVRGRLVFQDGKPAPQRRVQVIGLDAARLFDGDPSTLAPTVPLTRASTQSDADGRFVLNDLRPRALMVLQAGRGTPHSACVPIACTPGPDQVVDLGDITLEDRGSVRGRVADEDGAPVAGAEVWLAAVPAVLTLVANFERFAPAQGGMLLLPRLQAGETVDTLTKRTRSFLGSQLFMETLTPGPDTEVHVLDTPDWWARLWDALPIARTLTAKDGSFRLDDVAPGVGMLVARRAGLACFVKSSLKVRAGEVRDAGTLTLTTGETCRGKVRDHDGRAVPSAAVRVAAVPAAGFRGLVFSEAEVRTDAGGSFAVSGMNTGRAMVAARRAADRPWTVVGPIDVLADAEVTLPAPVELRLRLPALADRASVRLSFGPALGELARMGLRRAVDMSSRLRVADADTLVVGDLEPGSYLLEVGAPGHVTTCRLVSAPGEVELELAVATPAFEVLVTSSGNTPLPGARVACVPQAEDLAAPVLPTYFGVPKPKILAESLGCTDARGVLRVQGRAPGPLTLWAEHPRHGRAQQRVELPAARVLVQLPEAATLRGVLTDNGQPASASRWRIAVEACGRDDSATHPYALALPTADGSFVLTGLEPGPHSVSVEAALPPRLDIAALQSLLQDRIFSFFDAGAQRSKEIVLHAGEVRELRLDTDAQRDPPATPLRVVGRVLVDGAAAAGLTVQVAPPQFSDLTWSLPAGPSGITDADGAFSIAGASEGIFEVVVTRGTGATRCTLARRKVALAPNASNEVSFAITTGRVRGRVSPVAGRSLRQAMVTGVGAAGESFAAAIDDAGTFDSGAIASGRWTLDLMGPEILGPQEAVVVEVAAGARSSDVELRAEGAFQLEITLAEHAPGTDTWVELEHPASHSIRVHVSDKDGRVRYTGLRAGTYLLHTDGEHPCSGKVELGGEALHRVTLSSRGVTR